MGTFGLRTRPSFNQKPTVTKPDGTFTIGSLPPGTQYLTVAPPKEGLPEWIGNVVEVNTEPGKTTPDVKVEVTRGGLLEVIVQDDNNHDPIAEATVGVLQMENQQHHSAKTDATGAARFRLVPGQQYMVQNVWKKEYQYSPQQRLAAVELGKTTRIEIPLRSTPKVTGLVRDPQGTPLEGVTIRILPGGRQDEETDTDGKFSIVWDKAFWGGREETTFCLVARHLEKNLAVVHILDDENHTLDIKLLDGITFTGKVTDPQGKPIPRAETRLMLNMGNWGSPIDSRRSAKTDEEGKFQIKAVPPGHRFSVSAHAKGYGNQNMQVDSDDAHEKILDVGAFGLALANLSVSGTVVDTDDKPVAGADINAYGEGQPDHPPRIQSDAQGKFTIEGVCAGRLNLSASVRGENQLRGYIQTEGGATDLKIVVSQESRGSRFVPRQPTSLQGKTLEKFDELNFPAPDPNGAPYPNLQNKPILLCFFDKNQRPSRHCIKQLVKQQPKLAEKNVIWLAVQASPVEKNALQAWIEKSKITVPVGMISENNEEIRFRWGVRSLPWLILTDTEHRVIASGFRVADLQEKLDILAQ